MINLVSQNVPTVASQAVFAALVRSCSARLVRYITPRQAVSLGDEKHIWVFIDPVDEEINCFHSLTKRADQKLILFGVCDESIKRSLDLKPAYKPDNPELQFQCPAAVPNEISESNASVVYYAGHFDVAGKPFRRLCCRFDYANEWNNLNYGMIGFDASAWSLAEFVVAPEAQTTASLHFGAENIASFSGIWTYDNASILWINRSVGVIDGPDWRYVEDFISDHRSEQLHCSPVISDIPYGYNLAVTSRLDCDEDIGSAWQLYKTYLQQSVPFSIAITTKLFDISFDQSLIDSILAEGGAILAHSHSHAPHWGGAPESAMAEAIASRDRLTGVTGKSPEFAVAPFHHTPAFAMEALATAGFKGCVGGTMAGYQEACLARAGQIDPSNMFVMQSQQCMLHGHTISLSGDPLKIPKFGALLAQRSQSWFGYLDHPFSDRYQYDWPSEDKRCSIHLNLINYLKGLPDTLFANEQDALSFIYGKQFLEFDGETQTFRAPKLPFDHNWSYGCRHANRYFRIK